MADKVFTARWVFPVSGPPLERGVLVISDGRVVAAARHGRMTPDVDFGNAAIVPGFVNAHTHLDLTGARGLMPPTPLFTAWLRSVIAYRKTLSPEQVDADIQAGIAECLRYGTTSIWDISADGRSFDWLAKSPIAGIVFHEILGLTPQRAEASIADCQKWTSQSSVNPLELVDLSAARFPEPVTDAEKRMQKLLTKALEKSQHVLVEDSRQSRVRRALSPHAPYSVRFPAIQEAFEYSRRWRPNPLPLAIHLAESHEELELIEHHTGHFVEFLKELGVWSASELAPSLQSIIELARDDQEVLLVHCNYLPPETPIPPQCSIVYCPRTHAAFSHPPHPFREFLARGVRVRLGTDSLASNPDLSILGEARFIASRYPDLDQASLLDMATGALLPGKSADFAVVALPNGDNADPHELLFNSDLPVQSTWFRGQGVFKLV